MNTKIFIFLFHFFLIVNSVMFASESDDNKIKNSLINFALDISGQFDGLFDINTNSNEVLQEEIITKKLSIYQERGFYSQSIGFDLTLYPLRSFWGFHSSLVDSGSGWVLLDVADCKKYSAGVTCNRDKSSLLTISSWSAYIGPAFRIFPEFDLPWYTSFDLSAGFYYNEINFTRTAELLTGSTLPSQSSLSWYARFSYTAYTNLLWNPGLYFRIGAEIRNSDVRLPGVTEKLTGMVAALFFQVGISY